MAFFKTARELEIISFRLTHQKARAERINEKLDALAEALGFSFTFEDDIPARYVARRTEPEPKANE